MYNVPNGVFRYKAYIVTDGFYIVIRETGSIYSEITSVETKVRAPSSS